MRNLIKSTRERVLDGVDLLIDFLTLGEYGLEQPPSAVCVAAIDRGEHLPAHLDRALEHARV